MPILYAPRGIPGSGKSFWAEKWVAEDPENRVRINRDEIRFAMFGKYWGVDEDAVSVTETALLLAAIAARKDIVVDRTNIKVEAVEELRTFCKAYDYNFQLKEFSSTVEEAIERIGGRERKVGDEVIRLLHAQLEEVKFNELEATVRDYRLPGFDGGLEACDECGETAVNARETLDGEWVELICGACGIKTGERI